MSTITSVKVGSLEDLPVLDDRPSAELPVLLDDAAPRRADVLPADFPENAKPVGDGSYTLTFAYPVALRFKDPSTEEITSQNYSALTLQRLTGKTHKEVRNAAPEDFRAQVIASLAGLSLGRARLLEDRMDVSDIMAVLIVYRFFTTPGRRTGP